VLVINFSWTIIIFDVNFKVPIFKFHQAYFMRKIGLAILLFLVECSAFAQLTKAEGNGKFSFLYEYKIADANDHFFLVQEGQKKKLKITLPEANKDWRINGKPFFITSDMVLVPVAKQTDLLMGRYYDKQYNIFIPREDGGYFIKNPKDYMGYLFNSISYNSCFVYVDGATLDAKGNNISGSIYSYVQPDYTLIKEGNIYTVFNKHCQKLQFDVESKFGVLEFGSNYLGYFKDGAFYIVDVQKERQISYPSFPEKFLEMWAKVHDIWSVFKETRAIPIITDKQTWTFINEKGEWIFEPIKANLLFPYVYYNKYAPINREGKWGLVDRQGKFVYPCSFDSLLAGRDAYNSVFTRNDSIFRVKSDGSLLAERKIKLKNNEPTQKSEVFYESVCLVYIFSHESSGKKAYILVELTYNPKTINHDKMSSWVLKAIQSEVSGLWEYGYHRNYTSWNNPYTADIINERSCYSIETEYRQVSSMVSVIRKTFD